MKFKRIVFLVSVVGLFGASQVNAFGPFKEFFGGSKSSSTPKEAKGQALTSKTTIARDDQSARTSRLLPTPPGLKTGARDSLPTREDAAPKLGRERLNEIKDQRREIRSKKPTDAQQKALDAEAVEQFFGRAKGSQSAREKYAEEFREINKVRAEEKTLKNQEKAVKKEIRKEKIEVFKSKVFGKKKNSKDDDFAKMLKDGEARRSEITTAQSVGASQLFIPKALTEKPESVDVAREHLKDAKDLKNKADRRLEAAKKAFQDSNEDNFTEKYSEYREKTTAVSKAVKSLKKLQEGDDVNDADLSRAKEKVVRAQRSLASFEKGLDRQERAGLKDYDLQVRGFEAQVKRAEKLVAKKREDLEEVQKSGPLKAKPLRQLGKKLYDKEFQE